MKQKLISLIFVGVSIFSCNIGSYPGVDQELIADLKKKKEEGHDDQEGAG
jgi:hypothetical protein